MGYDACCLEKNVMSTRFSAVSKTLLILALFASSRAFTQGEAKQPKQLQYVTWVTFSSDGKLLAAGWHAGSVVIWDVTSGRQLHVLKGHKYGSRWIGFSPNGKVLGSLSGDLRSPNMRLWDVKTGKELPRLENLPKTSYFAGFSPDGTVLALGRYTTVTLVNLTNGRHQTIDLPETVAFSPDGKLLAGARGDLGGVAVIKLWDVKQRRVLKTMRGHESFIQSVTFSPDSKTLATAGADGTIKLWDVKTGRNRRTLEKHVLTVYDITFMNDGKTLVSAGYEGSVKFWDVATGRLLNTFTRERNDFAAVSPDGKILAWGTNEGKVSLWNTKTGKEYRVLTPKSK